MEPVAAHACMQWKVWSSCLHATVGREETPHVVEALRVDGLVQVARLLERVHHGHAPPVEYHPGGSKCSGAMCVYFLTTMLCRLACRTPEPPGA